jgi:oxaloacetate decarboxylase gamma subunit
LEVDLISEAIKYMALGMSVVFMFLFIMVKTLDIQSSILQKLFPNKEPDKVSSNSSPKKQNNQTKKIAASSAAIAFHKSKK